MKQETKTGLLNMRRYSSVLVLSLLSGMSMELSAATNYYVSSTLGNDSSDGTSTNSCWKTLSKVSSVDLSDGDTVYLRKGDVWDERLDLHNAGTSSNPITVTAYGSGPMPKIQRNFGSDEWCIYITQFGIKISGIEMCNAEQGIYINLSESTYADYIQIENCYFHAISMARGAIPEYILDTERWGCAVYMQTRGTGTRDKLTNLTIKNNIIQNCDGLFESVPSSANTTAPHGCSIRYVTIEGNTAMGCPYNTIDLPGSYRDVTIQNNVFTHNGGTRRCPFGGTDVMAGGVLDSSINNNEFGWRVRYPGDPDGCAVDYEWGDLNLRTTSNLFHDCDAAGVFIFSNPQGPWPSTNILVDSNIFAYNSANPPDTTDYGEIAIPGGSPKGRISNNTYYLRSGQSFITGSGVGGIALTNNSPGEKLFAQTPTADVAGGTYANPQTVTLSCGTSGAVIHYTTNGSLPQITSPVYAGPITINETAALNAKAYKEGMEQSYSLSAIYVISHEPSCALITTQPANVMVYASQTATFSVTASGTPPLFYQWYTNNAAIGGATGTTYTTPPTTTNESGTQFKVTVTNAYGAVTSPVATLTVNPLPVVTVVAAGGTVTNYTLNGLSFRAHIFTNTAASTSLVVSAGGNVEVLVVAGGGGGGQNGGGGGGAGGVIYSNAFSVAAGSNYTVIVGAGGPVHPNDASNPTTGMNSVFGSLTALGGGGGSSRDAGGQAANGGSGGGGGGATDSPRHQAGSGTTGQGNSGGYGLAPNQGVHATGGGGGGAGTPGIAGAYEVAGNGGMGVCYAAFANLGGSPGGWFAGGGAGGRVVNGSNGTGGKGGGGDASAGPVANTGGGGCGNGSGGPSAQVGASGIVIVRYVVASDPYEAWRQTYFTPGELADSEVSGDDADPDHDNFSNQKEYLAGTNPTNGLSLLVMTDVAPNLGAPGEFIVRWQSASNRWYTLQAATNLMSGFNLNLRTNIPANPPVNVHTDSVEGVGYRFYRISVE